MRAPTQTASLKWPWLVAALLLMGLLCVYPPFRVLSLRGDASAPVTFDPVSVAAHLWKDRIQPAAEKAPELGAVLAEMKQDPAAAAKHSARQVGLGGVAYYFLRGTGRIVAVEKNRLLVAPDGIENSTIAVRTGPIFGNLLRDGCGLLEVNDVPGLQDFNALAAELNRLAEEKVLPALKANAVVGQRIIFAGCAEAPETVSSDKPWLNFVAVKAEVIP